MKKTSLILSSVFAGAVLAMGSLILLPSVHAEKVPSENVMVTEKTASFSIENMTCAACPITVKKAMQGVEGVKSVNFNYQARTATVDFDSALTTEQKIGDASTNAGYPATLIPEATNG